MDEKHSSDYQPVQMGIKHKQGMPMQSQFEQAILDVYDFCIKEKEAGVPIIPLNHFAKRVTEMLKISDSSVKRVLKKRENGIPLAPLKRKRNRKSPITDVDDYMRDAILRKIHAYQYNDKHFTMGAFLEECRQDLGFRGCEKSLRRILEKQLGFEFKKVDNKLKIEQRKMKKGKIKAEVKTPPSTPGKVIHKKAMTKKEASVGGAVSVAIQTQTVQQQSQQQQPQQGIPILDISQLGHRQTIDDMGQVHSMHVHRLQHLEDGTPVMHRVVQQQQQQADSTIEHMTIAGLVHRGNVIESVHHIQQPPQQTSSNRMQEIEYKQEKY